IRRNLHDRLRPPRLLWRPPKLRASRPRKGISHEKAQNSQKNYVSFVPLCGYFPFVDSTVLPLAVMIAIEQPRAVALNTSGRFFQGLVRRLDDPSWQRPRCSQNSWIIYGYLVRQIFANAPEAFGNAHGVGMKISLFAKPGTFDEIPGFNHQCVRLPVPNGVTIV